MTLKGTVLTWMALLGVALLAVQAGAEETPVLKTMKDKVSYGLGVDIARNFKKQGIEADPDLVMKGLKDGLSGEKLLLPEEDLRLIMSGFRHELSKRRMEVLKLLAEENKKNGAAFLSENAHKEGVMTLPSGLQYKVLKAGDGKKPAEGDTVECNYRGNLMNGTELDKSEAGKPATFKLTAVIPGWKEALLLMPVGSKWQLFVPPHLAYGEKGSEGRIGPNATLVFELELVSIRPAEKATN
jgi:FKBP-type peptidyl-prolyl cis-trans isomerase